MRCLHIYPNGSQCPLAALEQESFCADHLPVELEEGSAVPPIYRFVRRVGAALLLIAFLFQIIVTLRALYDW